MPYSVELSMKKDLLTSRPALTFSALRSLSRLCPKSIVLSVNRLSKTACTSLIEVVTSSRSSSVIPLNL